MGRERRIWSAFLICLHMITSCHKSEISSGRQEIRLHICSSEIRTRAQLPDEDIIKDLNLLVLDSRGMLEEQIWINDYTIDNHSIIPLNLLKHKEYSFYACANLGKKIEARSKEELKAIKYHLAYPDDYREGIAMAGSLEGIRINDTLGDLGIDLERLMSKISLKIDRGGLSEGVNMNVTHLRIGNCPKSSLIFAPNSLKDHDQCFSLGFHLDESECSVLNRNSGMGISGEVSLYMLENLQGQFMEGNLQHDKDKVFTDKDIRAEICSYIEIWMDYQSPKFYSSGSPLKYRFYLGKDRNSLDIERNCHYRITIIPEDEGLSDSSWRVDKSGLKERDEAKYFYMSPSGYIQGNIGDTIHVHCNYHPAEAVVDIGLEELEFDHSRGIYDYTIDEDGKGVNIILKAPGSGILYMSAGEPINKSEMLVIEVNNIKN